MWRKCDLHRHTIPDTSGDFDFDPHNFLMDCVSEGLDVVAVTDHNRTDHIDAVMGEAKNHDITIVPGVEMDTDRGHVLALAPGPDGRNVLDEFCNRIPVIKSTDASFDRITSALSEPRVNGGDLFRNHVILVGAHVDLSGSLLGCSQSHSVTDQVTCAQHLQALEVVKDQTPKEWRQGIKQTDVVMALLRNTDAHPLDNHKIWSTWMYLPEVTPRFLRHAFATHESSISHEQHPPTGPEFWIKSIQFEDGPYSGRRIEFSPRTNALIGPPSSGKSLIVDAIRYVFSLPCAIDDVESSIQRRLSKCLPDGTTVKVEFENSDGHREIQRVRGGTTAPVVDAKPIVFSQVELSRRSMESIPSVDLLDLHCPQSAVHKQEAKEIADRFRPDYRAIVDLAKEARALRLEVDNEQEGLAPTRSTYLSLIGDETTAKSLGDLGRLENWHTVARQRLDEWRKDFLVPDRPELPVIPKLETDLSVSDYVPANAIPKALVVYRASVCRAADELVATLQVESDTRSPNVESLRRDIETSLGADRDATQELAEEVEEYRARLYLLEQKASDLAELDRKISEELRATDVLVDQASKSWADLRLARKVASAAVNKSMPSFFVKLNPDSLTTRIDQLLDDLSTGTYLQAASLREVRESLDRKFFVREAIRHLQFPCPPDDQKDSGQTCVNTRKIAQAAMDRRKVDGITELAVLWPDDGIELLQKQPGDVPVPFDNLTEGLKALAIKEISFAASQLPVVTDQPEDAVPTAAIFEKLVPAMREQRVSRQFIIASHDANVVVSGDMERVIVLPPGASEQPTVGTLFDPTVRARAITLLEGGDRAFELRRRRYGDYSKSDV